MEVILKKIALILCILMGLLGCSNEGTIEKKEKPISMKEIFKKSDVILPDVEVEKAGDRKISVDELKADFKAFGNALKQVNKLSDAYIPDIDEKLNALEGEIIDGMTEPEFYYLLQKAAANIPNSDTDIAPSISREHAIGNGEKLFPMDVVVEGGKIYVDQEESVEEILEINGISSIEILNAMRERVTSNMEQGSDYKISAQFPLLYFDIYGSYDEFTIKSMVDGVESENKLPGASKNGTALSTISKNAPTDSPVEFTYGTENKFSFGYLVIKTVQSGHEEAFYSKLDSAFDEMADKKPWIVVLDMRGNHTSNPEVIKYIYSKFIKTSSEFYENASEAELLGRIEPKVVYEVPRLYILTDASMGSLVNQLIIKLRQNPDTKCVGTNTSSGSVGFYDGDVRTLENTKIRFTCPKKRADISVIENFPKGLFPDTVDSKINYKNRQTPFLESIFGEECNT